MPFREMSVNSIRLAFAEILKKPLVDITLEEMIQICEQDSRSLSAAMGPYEGGFPELLRDFARIPAARAVSREKYLFDYLLERSSAAMELQPTLHLAGLAIRSLPYDGQVPGATARRVYHYERLDFKGAMLSSPAVIRVILSGGDISKINWRYIEGSDREKLQQLQTIVQEARALQAAGENSKGIKQLFSELIDPSKEVTEILENIQSHCVTRKASCLFRYCCCLYKRASQVQAFYQKWEGELGVAASKSVDTERTALIAARH